MTCTGFPVAVVGIGCRFPGARGPRDFWRLLMDGTDVVTEVPAARTGHPPLFPAAPGRDKRYGGFLDDVTGFDALFFGISAREAERMDPQQRLLLEVAWEALEDAHLPPPSLAGTRTGVFVGQMGRDYWDLQARHSAVDIQALTGSGLLSFASGRLSFALDLRGPSVSVDTACSSSLTAVHLACQSLRGGDSDTALAAGVNLVLIPELGALYERVRMIASRGRCRFGDASADGFVRSEGAGVVVLRPLDRALADGDRVYAVIAGSAINNDGRAGGSLVTPAREGQEAVLRDALARAGVDPAAVGYVEAHGTGTRVGDAVELRALSAVLGAGRPADAPCLVGSVKSNLGHSEGAAGIAGFIKTALSVYHGWIPGSLLLADSNPALTEAGASLRVPSGPVRWPAAAPAAGVAAFGLSGTNVHVVLTAAPLSAVRVDAAPLSAAPLSAVRVDAPLSAAPPPRPLLLPLSARHPVALRELAAAYAGLLDGADVPHAARICAAAARGRAHHRLRATAIGDDGPALAAALRALPPDVATTRAAPRTAVRPRVVFVFPSHGDEPGYRAVLGAGRVLPAVRAALGSCDKAAGYEIARSSAASLVTLWAAQVALAAHWQASGVQPDAVIGCGRGELAAAQVAGLITPGAAARLACPEHPLPGGHPAAEDTGMPTAATPLWSALAGKVMSGAELDAAHWAEVRRGGDEAGLADAVAAEASQGRVVFLEISAAPALTGRIRLALADGTGPAAPAGPAEDAVVLPGHWAGPGQPGGEELVRLIISATAGLYQAGADIAWESYYPHRACAEQLPGYPWQRKRAWFQAER